MIGRRADDERAGPSSDEDVRAAVMRLSRPHPSGGRTIERAAILASGAQSGAILAWIDAHAAVPEARVPVAAGRGLHSARLSERAGADTRPPLRYVLPPAALS
jgi:hypothetical protein